MKTPKIFLTLLAVSALALFFSSCSDDEEDVVPDGGVTLVDGDVSVDVTYLTFARGGGSQEITVFADAPWYVEGASWITVSPTSGSGDAPIVVTVDENKDEDSRTGTLAFGVQSGHSNATVTVHQSGYGADDEAEPQKVYVRELYKSATTVTVGWNINECDEATASRYAYDFGIYRDEACTDLEVMWSNNASTSMWKPGDNSRVWFTFSALEPETDYWVKVNVQYDEDSASDPLKITTDPAFGKGINVVTENAGEGDVILVENFDKIIHGSDDARKAEGIIPSSDNRVTLVKPEGKNPEGFGFCTWYSSVGYGPFPNSSSGVGLEYTKGVGLGDWLSGVTDNGTTTRVRPGYIQLGRTTGYMGYLATPELSAIPEGKKARVKVEFKAMPYHWGSWYADYVVVGVVDGVEGDSNLQVSSWGNTSDNGVLISRQNVAITQSDDDFISYSTELTGVTSTSRIRFSSYSASKGTFELDDIMITVLSVGDEDDEDDTEKVYVNELFKSATTVTVGWNVDGCDDETAATYGYDFGIYRDEACSDLVVKWTSGSGSSMWKPGNTARVRFTFSALEPETDYWVKVNVLGNSKSASDPLKITTESPFGQGVNVVTSNAAAGDVILVENFDKLIHGSDDARKGEGITASSGNRTTLVKPEGDNPSGFEFCTWYNSVGFGPFPNSSSGVGLEYTQAVGLGDWLSGVTDNGTTTRTRPGYIQLGRTTGYMGYLATPELSAIPAGKTATVKVEFKAMPYHWSSWYCDYVVVGVVEGVEGDSNLQVSTWGNTSDNGTLVSRQNVSITQSDDDFISYSTELTGVTSTSRIRFSSYSTSKGTFELDDLMITVVSLE